MPRVRRVRREDGEALRELRLRALLSEPHAFGSNYEAEATAPLDRWDKLAASASTGPSQFIALAELQGRLIGMAGGYEPDDAPEERGIWGTWVAPEARRQGIGVELVEAIRAWSEQAGAKRLTLWVVDSNEPAVTLYRSLGFSETGETQPLPSKPELTEIELAVFLEVDS